MRRLLLSRSCDQLVLGVGAVVLAGRLGVDRFAAISALFVVNSLAVTLADLGLGLEVLRSADERSTSRSHLGRLRAINGSLLVAAAVVGLVIGGTAGGVVVVTGLVWATAAESAVRRAALLRLGQERAVMRAELSGAAALALAIGACVALGDHALVVVGAGFVVKGVVESASASGWQRAFGPTSGLSVDRHHLWLAQLVAFGIANLDFVVLGAVGPSATFAVYFLAFRVASAVPAQLAYVAGRLVTVDLAAADDRQATYDRYTRTLFVVGIGGALVTAAVAPVLAAVLGDEWSDITWIVVLLALAIPWRMAINVAGNINVVTHRAADLLVDEIAHVAMLGVAYLLAASAGLGWFVGTVVVGNVLATTAYHRRAAARTGLRWWRALLPAGVVTVVAVLVLLPRISPPG